LGFDAAQTPRVRWGLPSTRAWSAQHLGRQPKHPRLGRPSVRWLQSRARSDGVA